uniref:Myb/SANT-like DNA-binding domain-containing protein n=1 Tax=Myripristis murdjan TaxID=586833 RepID=A0A668AE41_9TELE
MEERKRKKKFTAEELEILTKEVSKNENIFKGPHVSASKKNRVWENIAVKVNAVGHDKRSVEELKKRSTLLIPEGKLVQLLKFLREELNGKKQKCALEMCKKVCTLCLDVYSFIHFPNRLSS